MNKAQLIIFAAIGAIVLLAVLLITGAIPGLRERPPAPFTLTIWGSRDAPGLWQDLGRTYREEELASATIEYAQKDPKTYEAELVNALAAGRGPDLFLLTDADLEAHRDKIAPLPDGSLGYQKRSIKGVFADGAIGVITDPSGALLAAPLDFDTLALFYNRDYLNAANIPAPPKTWAELAGQVKTLTKLSAVGGIERSGAALGTAANVRHAPDIFAALLYQSGGAFADPATGRGALVNPATVLALTFYTSFANTAKSTYSWNAFFAPSLDAFADGETAMAIGYAADVPAVAARNPQLNFDVAPLPQATDAKTPTAFGRLDLLAVSRASPQHEQAWKFLLWLQSKDAQKTYLDAVGLPPSRRDLVASKPPREYLTPFYDQVLIARTLPPALGGSLPRIVHDMVEAVANRRFSVEQAIGRANDAITAAAPNAEPSE